MPRFESAAPAFLENQDPGQADDQVHQHHRIMSSTKNIGCYNYGHLFHETYVLMSSFYVIWVRSGASSSCSSLCFLLPPPCPSSCYWSHGPSPGLHSRRCHTRDRRWRVSWVTKRQSKNVCNELRQLKERSGSSHGDPFLGAQSKTSTIKLRPKHIKLFILFELKCSSVFISNGFLFKWHEFRLLWPHNNVGPKLVTQSLAQTRWSPALHSFLSPWGVLSIRLFSGEPGNPPDLDLETTIETSKESMAFWTLPSPFTTDFEVEKRAGDHH